jgi:hypothetical protein
MAITRAQQAKQLLKEGGRTGFFTAGLAAGDNISPGTKNTSNSGSSNNISSIGGDGSGRSRIQNERQAAFKQQQFKDLVEKGPGSDLETGRNREGLETLEALSVQKSNIPGVFGMGLNFTQKPRQFTLDVNKNFYISDPRTRKAREKYGLTAQGYKDYMSDRLAGNIDAAGNTIINNDDDDNDDNFIPVDTTFDMESGNTDQGTTEEEPFEISRRFRAEGGIMNSDVVGGEMDFDSARQMYGLGKLVKKVTKSVKKIAKSPIGKAALLYTGLGGLGNLASGASFFSNFASPTTFLSGSSLGNIFTKQGLGNIASRFGLGSMVSEKTAGDAVIKKFSPNFFGKILTSPTGLITAASTVAGLLTAEQEDEAQKLADETGFSIEEARNSILARAQGNVEGDVRARRFAAEGGSMDEPVAKKTMPLLDMDGQEMDLRAEGGFVPIGRMEKADDVPARLSKNEFVFTAEAVRNAGEGDVDKGAEVMYNMMKNLESGGEVSEESQGLEGAREMFQTSQRLEEVI